MYGCKIQEIIPGASVVNSRLAEILNGSRIKRIAVCLYVAFCLGLLLLPNVSNAATYTANVSLSSSAVSPVSLLADVLSSLTTGQYLGTSVASPFFPNTYSVTLKGRNPNYQPPIVPPPIVSTSLITLDTITNKLTSISTYTYIVGYAQGMLYERVHDAGVLGFHMGLCTSATTFNLVTIDSTTCNAVLGYVDQWIMSQSSGIAVVPNPPVGF